MRTASTLLAAVLAGSAASADTIYLHSVTKARSAACPYGGEREADQYTKFSLHVAPPNVVLLDGAPLSDCRVADESNWSCGSLSDGTFVRMMEGRLAAGSLNTIGDNATEEYRRRLCSYSETISPLTYWLGQAFGEHSDTHAATAPVNARAATNSAGTVILVIWLFAFMVAVAVALSSLRKRIDQREAAASRPPGSSTRPTARRGAIR